MKNKTKFVAIVLFLSVFIMLVSYGNQKVEWKGTIEKENGVKVIKNPREPLYGEIKFELEEDLSIGNEKDDNYMFYRIIDIVVDKEGNIYVLERGNTRLQKFDRNGNYICTMGRRGQGPSEFQMPSQVLIDDKKGIIGVRDGRKLIVFDKEGNYLDEDISFEELTYDLEIDSSGALWGISLKVEGSYDITADLYKVFVKLNAEGQIEKKIARFPYDMYRERREKTVISVTIGNEYNLFLSLIDSYNLVYGYSNEYEMNITDLKGNLLLKFKKDEPYRKFITEEKAKYKRAKLPEYKPFFHNIITDSKGRIYAQRNNVHRLKNLEKEFDIFSKNGFFLYKTVLSLTPFVIKNGLFYTRIINEDTGEVFVKRFKIQNWDQIKEGIKF